VVPGVALVLALLLFGAVWVARWPWRLVSTARMAMITPVAAPVELTAAAVPITLGAAAQRLPAAVQRDLVELAALLEEADIGGPS
jgi:hypothetical protein